MLTFRKATKSDLSELIKFPLNRKELFYFFPSATSPLTNKQLEKQLDERYESTVMLDGEQIVGFANFYNVQSYNIAFIGNIIIKPDRRREGLGKKLIRSMLTIGFKQLKLKEIHLSCYSDNTTALLFYNKLGFKPYAIEQRLNEEQNPVALIHLKLKKTD